MGSKGAGNIRPSFGRTLSLYFREILRRLKRRLLLGWMSPLRFRGPNPDRLLLAPVDLRTPDVFIASEIIDGRFPLVGQVFHARSTSPFDTPLKNDEFAAELHSFRWLRHLRASDDDQAHMVAKDLTDSWMKKHTKRMSRPAWTLDIVAQRLIAWFSHSPIVLASADHVFYRRFMTAIALQIRYLRHVTRSHNDPASRLRARIAIAMASLCLPSTNATVKAATGALDEELKRQILPDGGHISRNPQVILDILGDLLPLRQTYINLGCALPLQMLPSIDRMFLALRFFRHSSGDIALFNGSSYVSANYLMSILQNDESGSQNPINLNYSEYSRLEAGKSVCIIDTGKAANVGLTRKAHAGTLSFEFSSGANRIIVNGGFPRYQKEKYGKFSRLTAAHSTLIVEDTSSSRVANSKFLGPIFITGPKNTVAGEHSDDDFRGIIASHDGYLKPFGIIHQRQIRLDRDGKSLSGLDIVEDQKSVKKSKLANRHVTIRFHIHPSVGLSQLQDGSILLEAHDGDRWIFNGTVSPRIENDIFFADLMGPRKSSQITLSFDTDEYRRIAWILKSIE